MRRLIGSWVIWTVALGVGLGAVLMERSSRVASAEDATPGGSAKRHSITVHSNRWQGIWRIFDRDTGARVAIRSDKHTPSQTITLPAGSYRLFPTARTSFGLFSVNAEGNTQADDNLHMASYQGADITFRTFSIDVASGAWQGLWALNNGAIRPSKTAPVSPLTLVHNMEFDFALCNAQGAGSVRLTTTAQRLVVVPPGQTAVRFDPGTLHVQTTPLVVDSQDLGTAAWRVPNGPIRQAHGRCVEEVTVPRGTWVAFQVPGGGPRQRVHLDAEGRVTRVTGGASRRGEKLVALRLPEACRVERRLPSRSTLPGY